MDTTKHGSLIGATLLISGCSIGAGMLGLPVISALTGFPPSLLMFVLSWLFMTTTALLLLEVNLWFAHDVSLISMADKTLGITGKVIAWACFIFLFYALGVAYISGIGELVATFFLTKMGVIIPHWVGSVAVSAFFGLLIYLGTRTVDIFNRYLIAGLIISYVLLVIVGIPHVKAEHLLYHDWSFAPLVLPVMIISFGFHNMIPSLKTYLNGDIKRLKIAIICGGCLPLMIYLLWEGLILGLVPLHGEGGFLEVLASGDMATDLLERTAKNAWVTQITQFFAFFAILTSFLSNSLSFVDFLADGLRVKKDHIGVLLLCLLVIIPPLLLGTIYPNLFLFALNYAGAFGAVILFGVLPVLMVWSGRYKLELLGERVVPGGKVVLGVILLFCLIVMGLQCVN